MTTLSFLCRIHVNESKLLESKCWHGGFVEFRNLVQHFNGFLVSAFADQKLGRFVEREYEIPDKEYEERYGADNNDFVAPAHIARDRTAWLAGVEARSITSRQFHVTSIFCRRAKCNGRCNDDPDGLPNAKQCHEETAILR